MEPTMRTKHAQVWMMMVFGMLAVATCVWAQQDKTPPAKNTASVAGSRLTIEVSGGDQDKPIENASVYVKTVEEHRMKDKKFEVNVKTNMQGVAHVPDAPSGRVLIQIVAEGWKTYGHWYDVTDQNQVIKVHLERPPKWY